LYYINNYSGETTWTLPTEPALPTDEKKVQVYHILRKHRGSRRPSSWRQEVISKSIEEARDEIQRYITQLRNAESQGGFDALFQQFQEIAFNESDCGSHERGGDLGLFGRGSMQKPFEDESFRLNPGEMSGIVETDSGVHILLRVR
jgi:NIMA-interacting peptidyl-prolyl cis-trans isomerase 1